MRKHFVLLFACLMGMMPSFMAQDNVTNIRAKQIDKMVTITYDLQTRSDVRVLVSIDDGQHYTDTMKMTGYVNKIVPAGKNRVIRWQAFNNLGYGDYPEIRFKFITEEKVIDHNATSSKTRHRNSKPAGFLPGNRGSHGMKTFMTLNGGITNAKIPSFGFTVGQYDKFGWFVTLMSGFDFSYTGYQIVDQCEENGYIGSVLPFYNPKSNYTSVSAMAGGIFRLNDMMYVKAGLGYGMRCVSWELWEGTYVMNKGFSAHGVDVSAGLLFDFGGLVLTLDGATTNFHVFEARLGLGYRFGK